MNSISNLWEQLMAIPMAGWIVSFTGLAILLLIAFYVAGRLRTMALGQGDAPVNHLSEFEQLKNQGMLSDEEFRRVKAIAPPPLPEGMIPADLKATTGPATKLRTIPFEEVPAEDGGKPPESAPPEDREG